MTQKTELRGDRRYKVGLFSCEVLYHKALPHLGPCLLVDDIKEAGADCFNAVVNISRVEEIPAIARREGCDLVALESIFPLQAVRTIKEGLDAAPLLIGGVNALTLFLHSAADFAVVGPGRRAMCELLRVLSAGRANTNDYGVPSPRSERANPSGTETGRHREAAQDSIEPGRAGLDQGLRTIPNLFYRTAEQMVDHSGVEADWDIETELLPFRPQFEWDYLGPTPCEDRHLKLTPAVADFGCPHGRGGGSNPLFEGLAPHPILQDPHLAPRARQTIERQMKNLESGCSFCVFKTQASRQLPVSETVELLLAQMRYLRSRWKSEDLYIQSENPFRFLLPLLERVAAFDQLPKNLYLRSMPTLLVRHRETVEKAVEMLSAAGGCLTIMQLGFESFVQRHLDLFNKGVTVEQNIEACRILLELHRKFGKSSFKGFSGHGLILFHPWTTLEELSENLAAIEREAPFLKRATSLGARLTLYNEFTPIFRKAMQDGLVGRSGRDFGWDFRYQDRRMEQVAPLVGERLKTRRTPEAQFEVMKEVVRQLLDGYA